MNETDLIRERINIVDLIAESLELKKAGRNFKALCPFHSERTPSFVVSPERQIWHCFGCFPPGELIKTPFGLHPIETIDKNHWVVSANSRVCKVITSMVRQYKGDLISIITRKLRHKVRLTSDHQTLVVRGAPYTHKKYKDFSKRYRKYLKIKIIDPQKYFYKVNKYFPISQIAAGDLKSGDLLLYPLRRQSVDINTLDLSKYISRTTRLGPRPSVIPLKQKVSHELLKLIGYYIAEGSNHRAYIRFSIGNHEKDLAMEISRLIYNLFGLKTSLHKRKNSGKTGIEITACHSVLANIFENLCGKGASNKHIPFALQEIPVAKQRTLLSAIFKGDGTKFTGNKSRHFHKSITTISVVLAEQLVDVLLSLNFFPSLYIQSKKIDKLKVNHQKAYSVYWSEEATQKYKEIYYKPDGTAYWILPVDRITRQIYEGPVYNLSVAEDSSYVTSSFAVANCGKGGDIFTYLMELERIEFPEALKILAARAGVVLKDRIDTAQTKFKEKLLEMHHLASEYYHFLLTKHKIGERAKLYLKNRGISDKLIQTFELGFAPQSWDNLTRFLNKKGYRQEDLEKAGLSLRGKTTFYDRFRSRIIFPIKDVRGTTIAFAGRVLSPDVTEAKYINSPETPLYTKGASLFGIHLTKDSIRKSGKAVVVEGEFDAISSYQAGVTNVVAIKGTAMTEMQVNLLKRFCEKIYLALDADIAGDAASRRGIEIADRAGLEVRVVKIPSAKDPDEAARESGSLWKKAVESAVSFYDFMIESAVIRFGTSEAFSKKKIADEVLPQLKKLENSIIQAHYVKKLAGTVGLNEQAIYDAMQKLKLPQAGKIETAPQPKSPLSTQSQLEEYLLALLVQAEDVGATLKEITQFLDPSDFESIAVKRIIIALSEYINEKKGYKMHDFSKKLPAELVPVFDKAFLVDLTDLSVPEVFARELKSTLNSLKNKILRRIIKNLATSIKQAEAEEDLEKIKQLNLQLKEASTSLSSLS